MKVLFLTKYPPAGASSRYRVFQYLPYLDAAGVDYRVQSFMSPAMYALAQRPGHALRKSLHAAAALARRLAALWRCGRYDLIFLQRECLPLGPPLMERLFRRWRIPTIFDYDDALFIVKPSTHNGFADGLRSGARTREILRLVDCVLAGNDWLRARAVDAGAAAARTLHVAEDLARCTRRPAHAGAATTIGWLGSPSTEKYLDLLREPLRALCRRRSADSGRTPPLGLRARSRRPARVRRRSDAAAAGGMVARQVRRQGAHLHGRRRAGGLHRHRLQQ